VVHGLKALLIYETLAFLGRGFMLIFIKILLFVFIFNSCISIDLDALRDKQAKGVVYLPPPSPYENIKKEGMDVSWENPTNKSVLSFFSNCSVASRFITLKQFQKELLEGLKGFEVLSQKETSHQEAKAHSLYLENLVGKAIYMKLLIFKTEKCFYTLSFLALDKKHILEERVFDNFIKGFRVP